jgi:hypothetical protein
MQNPYAFHRPWLTLLLMLVAAGCAGEGAGGSATSGGASLADIQQQIFTPSCAFFGCHDAVIQQGGLNLSSVAASHAGLLNAASTLCAGRTLVVAGDPNASYLMNKVGASIDRCGAQMPDIGGLPSLSNEQLEQIGSWIEAGAEPPLSTTTTSPTTSTSSTTSTSLTTSTTLF